MSTPHVEMDLQGLFIRQRLDSDALGDQALELDASLWHMIDVERALTRCGLSLTLGQERRIWSETPEDRRCETCVGRFAKDVVPRGLTGLAIAAENHSIG
jgi:hypothetical protein